ncbi:hypothetical protein [Actinomadura decatromicini]|uniref:PASTA domain-containing protein n=1 Tax=Actinomadura decatromicini TaxID=2604572 RepID=A0A5D3F6P1_9ACTN|nr:hypothetical protein [Actinomadura decatromicini]TYK43729.1 hypothetical protein FXF68_36895 [Actinomadura decatromicini]
MVKKLLVISGVVVMAFGLSACGGDSEDEVGGIKVPEGASVSANPDGGGSIQGNQTLNPDQMKMATKFVACMRGLGYDMPEPSDPGFNFSPKNAQGMGAAKLQQVRKDSVQCSDKSGGSSLTGG